MRLSQIGRRATKPFDVLAADQRQKVAEFLAVKIEQHVAMPDLFLRHLVVHFGGIGIGAAKRVGEGAIDAVVLVLVGNRERKNFLLVQVGKAFHRLPLGGSICGTLRNSILEQF